MKRAALIVIDMINDGFDGWEPQSRADLTRNINQLATSFRERKLPIVWVRQEFEPDLHDAFLEMRKHKIQKYIKGTQGPQILPELHVHPDDIMVVKKRYSCFFNTHLDEILKSTKSELLVLAGINTHACIRTTAIDAYQRDWKVVLAENCISSYNSDWHKSSLEYMKDRVASVMHADGIPSLLL